MRIPFIMKKKPEQPRTERGTFAATNPSPPRLATAETVKVVEQESKLFSTLTEGFKAIDGILNEREKARAAILESAVPEQEETGLLDVLATLAPYIGPQLPGIIEKYLGIPASPSGSTSSNLGAGEWRPAEQAQGVSVSLTQQPSPSAGVDGIQLIKDAAVTNPKLIKAALHAQGYSKLEQAGISREEFKQAILNISKAV